MTGADNWTSPQTVIALLFLAILGGTVGGVFFFHDLQTVSQTVGQVGSIAGMVAGFYFGSTSSSRRKDETIANMAGPIVPKASL